MNNTISSINEINSLILPAVSVFCQLVLALVLFCLKKLEINNYVKLNRLQETILESVSRSGLSARPDDNSPYQDSEPPVSTHRDYPMGDYVLRIKK